MKSDFKFSVIVFVSIALLLEGCSPDPPKPIHFHLFAALDASKSDRAHLYASSSLLCRLTSVLDGDTDELTAYRVDREVTEFWDGKLPVSGEALQRVITKEIRSLPARDRTAPAAFWSAVADRVAGSPDPAEVVYLGDADDDTGSPASTRAMSRAARLIARNPRAVVVFCGADRAHWSALRKTFAPLGPRLHLYTASEMSLDALSDGADQARTLRAEGKGL